MKIAVVLLFVLLMLLTPNPVVPEESLAADGARASTAQSAAVEPAEAGDQEEDEEPLEEFVPTQKISADHSVSFPVDI
jgi:hypothetical protein